MKAKDPIPKSAASLGDEAYENDFRPAGGPPSKYAQSIMPSYLKEAMEKRQLSLGKMLKIAAE